MRRLWQVLVALVALTLLAEFLVEPRPHFDAERVFGFYAIYGFIACVELILIAKAIGLFLKRRDTYYDE